MASFQKANGASDFDPDATNNFQDTRNFQGSGSVAGVESGLSMVENVKRGSVESEQATMGTTFRREVGETPAGNKNGKNFQFK